jgi:uncharacterized membrane protein YeaQ/YmgE (transglycosylase-associated protein family)
MLTLGVLATSIAQPRFAKRHAQRSLVIAGFSVAIIGVVVLLVLANGSPSPWAFTPGVFLLVIASIAGLVAAILLPRRPARPCLCLQRPNPPRPGDLGTRPAILPV